MDHSSTILWVSTLIVALLDVDGFAAIISFGADIAADLQSKKSLVRRCE